MLPTLFDEIGRLPLFFEDDSVRTFAPTFDVFEYADRYELRFDVPGIAKADLKITFEDGVLQLSGERKAPAETEATRRERWTGSFERSITLPDDAEPASLEAKLADGVLAVTVKKAEAKKPRQITIG